MRIRGYYERDKRYFSAVAEYFDVNDWDWDWDWYDGITTDKIAVKLDSTGADPFNLEAYRERGTEYDVHYMVIMYRYRGGD